MKEVFTLRNLGKAVLATGLGAEAIFLKRMHRPPHNLDHSTSEQLAPLIGKVSRKIDLVGFDKLLRLKNGSVKIDVNKRAVAEAISLLSYLDGGIKQTQAVVESIEERGLQLKKAGPSGTSLAHFEPSLGVADPFAVAFGDLMLSSYYKKLPIPADDRVVWHELYHLIQQAKDIEGYNTRLYGVSALVGTAGLAGGAAGIMSGLELAKNINSRRRLLLGIPFATVGGILYGGLASWASVIASGPIEPAEQEAWIRGEHLGTLKPLDHLRGQIFKFS